MALAQAVNSYSIGGPAIDDGVGDVAARRRKIGAARAYRPVPRGTGAAPQG